MKTTDPVEGHCSNGSIASGLARPSSLLGTLATPARLRAMKAGSASLSALIVLIMSAPIAKAQVFEVQHPHVERGHFELEILNGFTMGRLADGEQRSGHEIALGYSPTSFWKTKIAIEFENAVGEPAEVEAVEWENLFVAEFGDHDHDHDEGGGAAFSLVAIGLYTALEFPRGGGLSAGSFTIGPIAEVQVGQATAVANLLIDFPFEDGEPGLAYAFSAAFPVLEEPSLGLAAGLEAHGGVEAVFGGGVSLGDNTHVLGPALYADINLDRRRVLEPRLALLFGLTDASPDAVASLNIELKF